MHCHLSSGGGVCVADERLDALECPGARQHWLHCAFRCVASDVERTRTKNGDDDDYDGGVDDIDDNDDNDGDDGDDDDERWGW